ncbi:hypothetical protein ACQ86O_26475 [Serratia sp. L9]|uniref:hypothetical protein n=1 Tax=Serratia sp. L9 TaxID=3423946 RepID=UPI003D667D02
MSRPVACLWEKSCSLNVRVNAQHGGLYFISPACGVSGAASGIFMVRKWIKHLSCFLTIKAAQPAVVFALATWGKPHVKLSCQRRESGA